jgi:hypothetical protein
MHRREPIFNQFLRTEGIHSLWIHKVIHDETGVVFTMKRVYLAR